MSFRPKRHSAYEPLTTTSKRDCVAQTAADLVERVTVGAIRPTHAQIRAASGAPSDRGLYLWEAVKAVKALYGIALVASLHNSHATMRDLVAGGAAVGVTGDCSITVTTSRRTNYYTGIHEQFVAATNAWPAGEPCSCDLHTAAAHIEYTVEDPGTTSVGYLQWSASLMYRFAEAATGGQGINLLIAPDTEGRPWKAREAASIRSRPSYSEGVALAKTVVGHIYPGGRTENGGRWARKDGTMADGWIHIKFGTQWGWVKGRAMVMA